MVHVDVLVAPIPGHHRFDVCHRHDWHLADRTEHDARHSRYGLSGDHIGSPRCGDARVHLYQAPVGPGDAVGHALQQGDFGDETPYTMYCGSVPSRDRNDRSHVLGTALGPDELDAAAAVVSNDAVDPIQCARFRECVDAIVL